MCNRTRHLLDDHDGSSTFRGTWKGDEEIGHINRGNPLAFLVYAYDQQENSLFDNRYGNPVYLCTSCIGQYTSYCDKHMMIACDCEEAEAFDIMADRSLEGVELEAVIWEGYFHHRVIMNGRGGRPLTSFKCASCKKVWELPKSMRHSNAAKKGWETRKKNDKRCQELIDEWYKTDAKEFKKRSMAAKKGWKTRKRNLRAVYYS